MPLDRRTIKSWLSWIFYLIGIIVVIILLIFIADWLDFEDWLDDLGDWGDLVEILLEFILGAFLILCYVFVIKAIDYIINITDNEQ